MEFISQIYVANKEDPPTILEEKLFWIGGGIFVLGALIMILSDRISGFTWIHTIGQIVSIVGLILFFYGRFAAMAKNEPLNGKLTEQIKISTKRINMGQNEYPISEINKLRIFAGDYDGKMYPKYNYIGPWCSNGVKSNISFEFNGQKISQSFYVADKSKMKELKKIKTEIKKYHYLEL